MLRVLVVSYHYPDGENSRPTLVRRVFAEMPGGIAVKAIASDFDHFSKRTMPSSVGGIIRLPVRPYRKNISTARLLSYADFAWRLRKHPAVAEADIIYVCVPCYLSALAVLFGRARRRQKVLVDVVDLWPEALPLPRIVNRLIKGTIGAGIKSLRRRIFGGADLLFFQSRYFLNKYGGNSVRHKFLPMCLSGASLAENVTRRSSLSKEVRILFLGSMNSITDMASLVQLLQLLAKQRKVCFSVIGGGNSLEWLKERLKATTVTATFHGITFDKRIKEEELSRAHFGFNGYKETTEVSVSYKSLEYLQHGIPLINSAKGDMIELVASEKCGLNYNAKDLQPVVNNIIAMSDADHAVMRQNALRTFDENFSYGHFSKILTTCIMDLLADGPQSG